MGPRAWRVVRSATAVVVVGAATAAGAGSASAGTFRGAQDAVVAYSDPGDYIGGGAQQVWRGDDSSISLYGGDSSLSVSVDGGPSRQYFTFNLAAPSGTKLGVGVYTDAERASFRTGGHPGIDISGSGRGCNTDAGRFEIRDIARDANGEITRLWAIYEQHCEGNAPAMWGEIRVGMPTRPLASASLPSVVRWPVGDAGTARTTVPVTVVAGDAGLAIDRVGLGGADASDFKVRENGCTGQVLGPGRTCQVWVRFLGASPGTREATLSVVDAAGGRYDTALQGWSYGGTTAFRLSGDAGDYITGGRSYAFTPANAQIVVRGTRSGLGANITGPDGNWWYASIAPSSGDILVAGDTFTGAHRNAFRGTSPGLDVSGEGRGCNTLTGSFTVNEARWFEDGTVRSADVDFEQHCDDRDPAARGSLRWRSGDTTTPAVWMRASSSPTALPVPPATVTGVPATPTTATGPAPTDPAEPTTTTTGSGTTGGGSTSSGSSSGGSSSGGTSTVTTTGSSSGATGASSSGTGSSTSGAPARTAPEAFAWPTFVAAGAPSPASPTTTATTAAGPAAAPLLTFKGLRSGGRTLRFAVRLPGAGVLKVAPSATVRGAGGRARVVRLGSARISATRAGSRTVSVRLSARTRRILAAAGTAPMTTGLTWRATGTGAVTSRATDVLRMR